MLFRRRGRPANLRRFRTVAAIAVTPVIAMTGIWLWWANQDPDSTVPSPVMPVPNAYDDYVAATKLLVRTNEVGDALTPNERPRKLYTPAERAELVRANRPALDAMRRGFTHEYQEPPARSFAHLFPHYAKFRDLGRAFALEGRVKSAHGDHAGAMGSYLDAVQLGQTMPKGGPLIGHLVGIAVQAVGRKRAWEAVAHLDGAEARRAARRMEEINAREVPYADVIREEMRCVQAGMLEMFRKNEHLKIGNLVGTDESETAQVNHLAFAAWFQVYGKRRTMDNFTRYMEAQIAQAQRPYSIMTPEPPIPPDPLNRILVPVFSQARFRSVSSLQTQNALFTVTLALRAYRTERGEYPASLAQLAPGYLKSVPADPFGLGVPLRYRRTADGYRLYSVGPDARDDGGKAIDEPSQGNDPRKRYRVEQDSVGDIVAGINIYG